MLSNGQTAFLAWVIVSAVVGFVAWYFRRSKHDMIDDCYGLFGFLTYWFMAFCGTFLFAMAAVAGAVFWAFLGKI